MGQAYLKDVNPLDDALVAGIWSPEKGRATMLAAEEPSGPRTVARISGYVAEMLKCTCIVICETHKRDIMHRHSAYTEVGRGELRPEGECQT